jgi:toxin-antitoxin system PIN domain toxin
MISLDANILLYAVNEESPWQEESMNFIQELMKRRDVAISELMLVEFYTLLRNPMVLKDPLSAKEAVQVVNAYRHHPYWSLVGFDADSVQIHKQIWKWAGQKDFARRRIYDLRFALYLQHQGVTEFATVNTKDFKDLGFKKVWNPISG